VSAFRRRVGPLAGVIFACSFGWSVLPALELESHADGTAAKFTAEGNEALVQGDYDGAMKSYRAALDVDKRYFYAIFNLALAHQEQGNWERARSWYDEALLVRPDHPQVLNNLGIVDYATGSYRAAVNRFEAAAQVAATNKAETVDYLYNLATAHEQLQEWTEARDAYRKALDLDDQHFGCNYNLGTLYLGPLAQFGLAERHLLLARSIAPGRTEPILNLAVLSEKQGRIGEAEEFYNQAITLALDTRSDLLTDLLWRRITFYERRSPPRKVEMRRDLEAILRRDTDYPGANGLLGLHYHALGDYDRAIPLLEREVSDELFDAKSELDVEILYVLARVYNDLRPNPRLALRYATRFYQLRPDSAKVRDLRRRALQLPGNSP
jgi:tetratricopeptide (TPR) repeat protein